MMPKTARFMIPDGWLGVLLLSDGLIGTHRRIGIETVHYRPHHRHASLASLFLSQHPLMVP
ncbi:hypothetical protein CAI21_17295 [Alkalilimnicola ehrlichii]|uniref:Uncharacterized protein n=1 Tax=Alkalilimnicola ehrlichii TaxID=351052 RepID=A0A3E0WJQ0_9GAMM|nr:hypothetical protein CAI21_17295 [Alkalilimnicola ehrlichii]RFA33220.1 hypothetical protein CAL65_17780 [Alkalilimnicola ehrlichii]